MTIPVFESMPTVGNEVAPEHVTTDMRGEFNFWATVMQERGITPETFISLAGRFALLCDSVYRESDNKVLIDAAHPNITIVCDELEQELAANPGERLAVPVNNDIFKNLFGTVQAVDLVIEPVTTMPEMPSTFAKVTWQRNADKIMEFYAQGNDDFVEMLYARMFYVPNSAPSRKLDVAVGITAARELKRVGIGSDVFRQQQIDNFNFISVKLGRPSYEQLTGQHKSSGIIGRLKRRFF